MKMTDEKLQQCDVKRKIQIVNNDKDCTEAGEKDYLNSYGIRGVGDVIFSCVIVGPATITAWRGLWVTIARHDHIFPLVPCLVFALVLHCILTMLREPILSYFQDQTYFTGGFRWVMNRVVSRLYMYIFLVICIFHWRGIWDIHDYTINYYYPKRGDPKRFYLTGGILLFFYTTMIVLRLARNLNAPPVVVVTDSKVKTYDYSTRFSKRSSEESVLYVLDCIFSVTIVGSLVVFVWRGTWALLDMYLYPDDTAKSVWTSLIAGYGFIILTFSLQAPVRWAATRLQGAPRLLLADVYHLMSFIGTVNTWRGIWGILDLYLYPDYPELSNLGTHFISILILVILNCSNSVLVRGVYIDAEEPAGECVIFPCHYLRLYFHNERIKRRHKKALAVAAANRAREPLSPSQVPLVEKV